MKSERSLLSVEKVPRLKMNFLGLTTLIFGLLCLVNAVPVEDSKLIRPNTPANLAKLANLKPDDHAEFLSGQFEGDILMTDDELRQLQSKTGLIDTRFRWLNNEVPYWIETDFFDDAQIAHIEKAVNEMEAATCLKFVKRTYHHTDYITIKGNNDGCYSSVGRRGGVQTLNLTPYAPQTGCFYLTTIIHEFMHALGFYHQQSATERDEFVKIIWENIEPGLENNFNTYDANRITNFNILYDFGSIMHYPSTAFSINGEDTIVKIVENNEVMGQRIAMSASDIARMNAMYNCPVVIPPTTGPSISQRIIAALRQFFANFLGGLFGGM